MRQLTVARRLFACSSPKTHDEKATVAFSCVPQHTGVTNRICLQENVSVHGPSGLTTQLAKPKWSHMFWSTDTNNNNLNKYDDTNHDETKQSDRTHDDNSQRYYQHNRRYNHDGSRRQRGRKKNPRRKRGGIKKRRCRPVQPQGEQVQKNSNIVSFYFANPSSASEKAKMHLLERDDDVVLVAEHHKNKEQTLKLITFFGSNGWMATASPARPTERSETGTTAGVLTAVRNNIDNRPPSFATDAEGRTTPNAQITGRMMVLSGVEILALAGYLQCGLGFGGSNAVFLIEFDFITRGGKIPFILGIDANTPPEAWTEISWGSKFS